MKFFVDTADTAEIKSLAASGLLDGVTTNPSLMAKTGKRFQDVLELGLVELAACLGGFQEREQLLAPEDDLDLDRQRSPVRLLGRSFRGARGPKHAGHP